MCVWGGACTGLSLRGRGPDTLPVERQGEGECRRAREQDSVSPAGSGGHRKMLPAGGCLQPQRVPQGSWPTLYTTLWRIQDMLPRLLPEATKALASLHPDYHNMHAIMLISASTSSWASGGQIDRERSEHAFHTAYRALQAGHQWRGGRGVGPPARRDAWACVHQARRLCLQAVAAPSTRSAPASAYSCCQSTCRPSCTVLFHAHS